MSELARRAVACKRWRWMPGCATTNGGRIVNRLDYAGSVKLDRPTIQYAGPNGGAEWYNEVDFTKNGPSGLMALAPDLTDPATIGCLLALVREAWGDHRISVIALSNGKWGVSGDSNLAVGCWAMASTEAEALVAALEAAPEEVAK